MQIYFFRYALFGTGLGRDDEFDQGAMNGMNTTNQRTFTNKTASTR